MKKTEEKKQLYIVMSQTGSFLSRIIKIFTGAEYNHASVSVSADLEQMYSFGRIHPYNPFLGGFVMESLHTGTFKRFSNTRAIVIAVEVDEDQYVNISDFLLQMYLKREEYHYNYLGLFLAAFHIQRKKENCYYCSEFVGDILTKSHVLGANELDDIIQPIHFLSLPHRQLFCGKLREYSKG